MVMMVVRLFASLLFAIGFAGIAAQTSSHQRVGVERKSVVDITVDSGFELFPLANGAYLGVEADPYLTLDLLVLRSLDLSLALPASAWLDTDLLAPRRVVSAFGDPSVGIGYSLRIGDWRFGSSAIWIYPMGVWNYYESQELHLSSGSGYQTIGLDVSATRFIDPLIADLKLSARSNLPRAERFGESARPLTLTATASATEALNQNVGLIASLSNEIDSPIVGVAGVDGGAWLYSLSGSAALAFSSDILTLRVGLSKTLSNASSPPRLDVSIAYTLPIGKQL